MEIGKLYQEKCEEHQYTKELRECIERTCEYCIDTLSMSIDNNTDIKPIMMLGKIQSGKTKAYIGLIALSFDNCFDLAIILTKNSSPLVKQTYKRMRSEFSTNIINNEVDVFDIMNSVDSKLTEYELNKKIIIVAKKQKDNLDRISEFISNYGISSRKCCLIIDDEADTTSIGFYKVKNSDDEFDLRAVASRINSIRGCLEGYAMVQVTATPYALYLQPNFNENEIKCIKPQKTIIVPHGIDYFGGEYYFLESKKGNHPARFVYEEVSLNELELVSLPNGDRRRFKEEDILIDVNKLNVFKKGIINFIIGGCILRKINPNAHYSYVIHTNTQTSSHARHENITEIFYLSLKERDDITIPIIGKLLFESYKDIERSVKEFNFLMPDYEEIKADFFNAIDKDYISTSVINSKKQLEPYLNEDNGELRLRTPFSIFVGGQAIDRGVTIPNMIGFYYGRNPRLMQQDTVMQHSRMFGYRDQTMLSVTRFYTTRNIYENITKMTEFDEELRKDIETNEYQEGIYFLRKDENGKIIPCSPDKVKMSNIVFIKPGTRILTIGFSPICKSESIKSLREINKLLDTLIINDSKHEVLVSTDDLERIIMLAYEILTPDRDSVRFITKDKFISLFSYLTKKDKKAYLLVRRGRKLSKFKDNNTSYSDAPDTPQDELSIANQISQKYPVLMMIHQDGTGDGWQNREFWWPVLLVQRDLPRIVFSLDEPEGRIRRS